MTPEAIRQLQTSLGIPATGIFDTATSAAMDAAVAKSLSTNQDAKAFAGSNNLSAIHKAYLSGDWSGVTSLSGKPFTDEQQQAAVVQARSALAPAYEAQKAKDTGDTVSTLERNQTGFLENERDQAIKFGQDKNTLDENAADKGVLFAGSRLQKQRALGTAYQNADETARANAARSAGDTTRAYQYGYGNEAAQGLRSLYSLPGTPSYNAGVAGGKVTRSPLSAVYNPGSYNFQGTKPVAQNAAIQTRAAGLLGNRANKLSLSGVGAKF